MTTAIGGTPHVPDSGNSTDGPALPSRTFAVSRADLVRYCGASGDFNPIHWSERTAVAAGLPGVIAHGMFTMGLAISVVTDVVGTPDAVLDYETKFARPVVVPDDDRGVDVTVTGVLAERLPGRLARFELTVRVDGADVFGRCVVTARLPESWEAGITRVHDRP
jgi:acyl dehydratase